MKRTIILSLIAMFICTVAATAQTDETKYDRHVLIEEFTTEKCPNCPPVASMMRDFLETSEYKDRVVLVAHHSGFYTDWLTTEADQCMLWFYNSTGTYAPAMMFDRYPNFLDGRNRTPVGFVSNGADLYKYVKRRLNKKSHVSLDITAEFDNAKTLTVRVKGDRTKNFSNTDPVIFVYLTENNVKAQNQAGGGSNFKHAHVTRSYNHEWGVVLEWNGDTYEYECKLNVDPEWNKEELEIVAAISAFDVDDCNECVVENTRSIHFPTSNGIEDAAIEKNAVSTEYFTIDGVKAEALANGMYIQKITYSDGTVETKKICRK